MSLTVNSRLAVALRDAGSARVALNELHGQISVCQDERVLLELLAKYAALALAKQTVDGSAMRPASARELTIQRSMQNENRMYTAISNVMKTKHDVARNSINNVR